MSYSIKFLPIAQDEYESSIAWYAKRSELAVENFVKDVELSLEFICLQPQIFRKGYKSHYHYFMKNYPFTILYKINKAQSLIVVRSVYHQKRSPQNKYR